MTTTLRSLAPCLDHEIAQRVKLINAPAVKAEQ